MKEGLNAFVFADPEKCIGCRSCEMACFAVHSGNKLTVGCITSPVMPRLFLVRTPEATAPIQCRQCDNAPCAKSCPAGIISEIDGRIIINEEKCIEYQNCIGCKNCVTACPFGAIDLVPVYVNVETEKQHIKAIKCDLCAGRTEGPACVEVCPEKALKLVNTTLLKKEKNIAALKSFMNAAGIF